MGRKKRSWDANRVSIGIYGWCASHQKYSDLVVKNKEVPLVHHVS